MSDLEQCGCGRLYEPVDINGEEADCCKVCAENEAEAAYERFCERFYGGGEPVTLDEMHRAAWEEKRGLK